MTARIVLHDDRHYDELYALRVELFWIPNDDGSPSTNGKVVFHTLWHHFRDGRKFAQSPGPRIEHSFDAILNRTFLVPTPDGNVIPLGTMLLMGGVKQAFDELANEYLNPPPEPEPEPESEPESEPEPDAEPDAELKYAA